MTTEVRGAPAPAWVPSQVSRRAEILAAGLVVHDATGALVFENPRASILSGSHGPAAGSRWYVPVTTAAVRDRRGVPLSAAELPPARALGGEPVTCEIIGVRPDGDPDGPTVWLRVDAHPIRSGTDVIGVATTFLAADPPDFVAPVSTHSLDELLADRAFAIAEASLDLISILDRDGTFCYVSPVITRLLGYQPEDLIGTTLEGYVHPDEAAAVADLRHDCTSESSASVTHRMRRCDGTWSWIETSCRPIRNAAEEWEFHVTSRDVTERRALADFADRVIENSPVGLALVSADGRITLVNKALEVMLGFAAGELVGSTLSRLSHPDDAALEPSLVRDMLDGRLDSYRVPRRLITKDGTVRWMTVHVAVLAGSAGETHRLVVQVEDTDAAIRTQQELRRTESRLRAALDGSPQATFLVDIHGVVIHANPACRNQLGRDVVGESFVNTFDWVAHNVRLEMAEAIRRGHSLATPARFTLLRGDATALAAVSLSHLGDRATPETSFVGHITTEAVGLPDAPSIAHRATVDALTGVANRSEILHAVEEALRQADAIGEHIALLFCDLDEFKDVNDRFGHHIGDRVLVEVAAQLRTSVRRGDVVGRIGGDEFLVILRNIAGLNQARQIARMLAAAVWEVTAPNGRNQSISIGVAISHPGISAATLLAYADTDMYLSKARG